MNEDIQLLKFFFTRKAKLFINPIRLYSWHRRQIVEDFPASLPPEEEESILTTTMLLAAVKGYTTRPIVKQQFKQFKKVRPIP